MPVKGATSGKMSAGLLLYRHSVDGIAVLLVHLGGPFWRNKEIGSWSIPKGLITERETPLAAEKREFAEETGHRPRGNARSLGEAKQPGGKIVYVWAIEGDWDADTLKSNMFEMEWPPKSGKRQKFPELDRAGWFKINQAHEDFERASGVSRPPAESGSPGISRRAGFKPRLKKAGFMLLMRRITRPRPRLPRLRH